MGEMGPPRGRSLANPRDGCAKDRPLGLFVFRLIPSRVVMRVPVDTHYEVDLLFVEFIFVLRLFVQRFSSNPNLIGLDENALDQKALDENWVHS